MGKILASDLVSLFRQMKDEHWQYAAGAAERGKVDCSGAFVWAYKQFNRSIYHGSNRMARTEVTDLIPVKDAQIVPGMAAFKRREPGTSGYALPAEYRTGGGRCNGDLCDYYHVGLVAADGKTVLNAQSTQTGFVASPISERWSHVGYLKQVEYGGAEAGQGAAGADTNMGSGESVTAPTGPECDETPKGEDNLANSESVTPPQGAECDAVPSRLTVATVYADNSKPVKMRNRPIADDQKTTWDWVPVGATVTVRALGTDGWTPIRYNGREGYMMDKFLRYGQAGPNSGLPGRAEGTAKGAANTADDGSVTAPAGPECDDRAWLVSNLTEAEAREIVVWFPEGRMQETHG